MIDRPIEEVFDFLADGTNDPKFSPRVLEIEKTTEGEPGGRHGVREPGDREALRRAKARLDRLDLYPAPVDLRGVRILVVPWLFRVPGFRHFHGYATRHLVLLKRPMLDDDLIVHELCHVWQLQHELVRVWLSYARPSTFSRDRSRYRANRYERDARRAVELTRD